MMRGAALIAMALYHASWDLHAQGLLGVDPVNHPLFMGAARSIAATFLSLSGVSLILAHDKGIDWKAFRKREIQLVGAALLVSIGSAMMFPQSWIAFGILHHLALAAVLGVLLIGQTNAVLIGLAAISFSLPKFVTSDLLNGRMFEWLGLSAVVSPANDYVPLFPWFGFVLAGMIIGRWWLRSGAWQTRMSREPQAKATKALTLLGRHGLLFYLLHQPIMIGIMSAALALGLLEPHHTTEQNFTGACMRDCSVENPDAKACKRLCSCLYVELKDLPMMSARQGSEVSVADEQRIRSALAMCR